MSDSTDSQLRLAEQALAVAAAATAGHDTRRYQASSPSSGEFQTVLLGLVAELKVDGREHRQKIETVLVRLAEGDGRMDSIVLQGEATRDRLAAIESRLAVVEKTGTDSSGYLRGMEARLIAIEAGEASGIQRAIHTAVTQARKPASERTEAKKDIGLSLSNAATLKLLTLIGSIVLAAVTGYFALRQPPASPPAPPTAPTPAHP